MMADYFKEHLTHAEQFDLIIDCSACFPWAIVCSGFFHF